jgi:hypothetical protein
MARIKDSHPEVYARYTRWVTRNFSTALSQQIAALGSVASGQTDATGRLMFYPSTNQFVYTGGDGPSSSAEQAALNDVNSALTGLAGFMKADGKTPEQITNMIAELMGTQLRTGQTPGNSFWGGMLNAIESFSRQLPEGAPRVRPSTGIGSSRATVRDYADFLNIIGDANLPDNATPLQRSQAYNLVNGAPMDFSQNRLALSEMAPGTRIGRYGLTAESIAHILKGHPVTVNGRTVTIERPEDMTLDRLTPQVQDEIMRIFLDRAGISSTFLASARSRGGAGTRYMDDTVTRITQALPEAARDGAQGRIRDLLKRLYETQNYDRD